MTQQTPQPSAPGMGAADGVHPAFVPPRLPAALAKAVLPAYLLPAVQAGAAGYLTANDNLVHASYTTIAVPSAVAAVVVAVASRVADRRQRRRPRGRTIGAARAALTGAVAGAALATPATIALVTTGVFGSELLSQSIPSAAVGGGVTAFAWAMGRNRRLRRSAQPPQVTAPADRRSTSAESAQVTASAGGEPSRLEFTVTGPRQGGLRAAEVR